MLYKYQRVFDTSIRPERYLQSAVAKVARSLGVYSNTTKRDNRSASSMAGFRSHRCVNRRWRRRRRTAAAAAAAMASYCRRFFYLQLTSIRVRVILERLHWRHWSQLCLRYKRRGNDEAVCSSSYFSYTRRHQVMRSTDSFICEQKRSFASRISDGDIYLSFLSIHFRCFLYAYILHSSDRLLALGKSHNSQISVTC